MSDDSESEESSEITSLAFRVGREMIKMEILEQKRRKEEMENRYEEIARVEDERLRKVIDDQEKISEEIREIEEQIEAEELDQILKTDELRERLATEIEDMIFSNSLEQEENEKLQLEMSSSWKKQLVDRTKHNNQKRAALEISLHSETIKIENLLWSVSNKQSRSDDIKIVDAKITNVKNIARILHEHSNGVYLILCEGWDDKKKRLVLAKLEIMTRQFSAVLHELDEMEKKSECIVNYDVRSKLNSQIKEIREKINKFSGVEPSLTESSEDLFDLYRSKFGVEITTIINCINDIDQLTSEDDAIRQAIVDDVGSINFF